MLTRAAATMPSPVIHAKVVFERYNVRAHSTRLQSPEGVKSPRGMRRSEFVTRDSGGGWVVTVHAPTGSLDAGWDPWMQIWPLQHFGAQRPACPAEPPNISINSAASAPLRSRF